MKLFLYEKAFTLDTSVFKHPVCIYAALCKNYERDGELHSAGTFLKSRVCARKCFVSLT